MLWEFLNIYENMCRDELAFQQYFLVVSFIGGETTDHPEVPVRLRIA